MSKEILKGRVIAIKHNKAINQDTLVVSHKGQTILIPKNEVDIEKDWDNLTGFIGREINFIKLDTELDLNLGSRKKAQGIKRDELIEKLKNNEIVQARVVNLLKYGAYLEIDGSVTVLLKNNDFSNGHIAANEALKRGQVLNVRLKKITEQGKIQVETESKFIPNLDKYFEKINEGDVVTGTLKTLRPDMCFVNLYPGIDGLSSVPGELDLDEGMKVEFEIRKIDPATKKIRGKVIGIKKY